MILFCFVISEISFSGKKWNKNTVSVSLDQNENKITIKFLFIDYEFGLYGEHAYFESLAISHENYYGYSFIHLMSCEVHDQINIGVSKVYMKDKSILIPVRFVGCYVPENLSLWPENKNILVHVKNVANKGYLTVVWSLPLNVQIKAILFKGIWHVNGLNCCEEISGEAYPIENKMYLNMAEKPDSKLKYLFENSVDQTESNETKAYRDVDAVVVKGADFGQNIHIYTMFGAKVKSVVADKEVVTIKLPVN